LVRGGATPEPIIESGFPGREFIDLVLLGKRLRR
jgi:hypothetical protein